jgi:hypothetical protein
MLSAQAGTDIDAKTAPDRKAARSVPIGQAVLILLPPGINAAKTLGCSAFSDEPGVASYG